MTEQEQTELNLLLDVPENELADLCERLQTSQQCVLAKLDEMIDLLKQKKMIEYKVLLCHRRMTKSAQAKNPLDVRDALMEAHRWRRKRSPL